ncbi:MAG TPA: YidC/Oxa1 family membrane protein insertase [Egibacteraceae bacterium]|nr:YidC/Oxa1 family membrane protein insertase [Egibacteraceae bacterium]
MGAAAWGWGIVLLTILVRLFLLPLAVKQTRSMRAMQKLQPEMKKIQAKFKVDRGLMRSNPEKYKEQKAKQQEAMMALYKDNNVNPAASCLPLLLQMPIFFALYRVLAPGQTRLPQLQDASFYFFGGLSSAPNQLGPPEVIGAMLLIALMGATTFLSQKQMMAHTPSGQQMQQQKVLLYVMPLMLMFFGYNLPIGVLLYWVTTNIWTMGQQWFMFRNVEHAQVAAPEQERPTEAKPAAPAALDEPTPAPGKSGKQGSKQRSGQAPQRGKAKPTSKQRSKRKAG